MTNDVEEILKKKKESMILLKKQENTNLTHAINYMIRRNRAGYPI